MDVVGIDFIIELLKKAAVPGSISPICLSESSEGKLSMTGGREGFFLPYLPGKLILENRVGKRVSKGIYIYQRDKAVNDEPEFYLNPKRSRESEKTGDKKELIVKRLLYSIFNGSLYSLKKEMSSMEELDLGVREVLHTREGPFEMMRAMGAQKIREEFDFLTRNVGKRFRQTNLDFLSE